MHLIPETIPLFRRRRVQREEDYEHCDYSADQGEEEVDLQEGTTRSFSADNLPHI